LIQGDERGGEGRNDCSNNKTNISICIANISHKIVKSLLGQYREEKFSFALPLL